MHACTLSHKDKKDGHTGGSAGANSDVFRVLHDSLLPEDWNQTTTENNQQVKIAISPHPHVEKDAAATTCGDL